MRWRAFTLVLIFCLIVWLPAPAFGAGEQRGRPHIFGVQPLDSTDEIVASISHWQSTREGILRFLVELFAFYDGAHIYFLARDAELFYDLAQLLFRNDQESLKRIHLLNVSRNSSASDHLLEYLEQEGITLKDLDGRKAVLVDTGSEGSIPKKIQETVPASLRERIIAHFIISSAPHIPSSRVFREGANIKYLPGDPNVDTFAKGREGPKIVGGWHLEGLPHVTGSAQDYGQFSDPETGILRWIPLLAQKKTWDETFEVGSRLANLVMRDVAAFALRPETEVRFFRMLDAVKALVPLALGTVPSHQQEVRVVLQRLNEIGRASVLADLREAQICGNLSTPLSQVRSFWLGNDFAIDLREVLGYPDIALGHHFQGYREALDVLAQSSVPSGKSFSLASAYLVEEARKRPKLFIDLLEGLYESGARMAILGEGPVAEALEHPREALGKACFAVVRRNVRIQRLLAAVVFEDAKYGRIMTGMNAASLLRYAGVKSTLAQNALEANALGSETYDMESVNRILRNNLKRPQQARRLFKILNQRLTVDGFQKYPDQLEAMYGSIAILDTAFHCLRSGSDEDNAAVILFLRNGMKWLKDVRIRSQAVTALERVDRRQNARARIDGCQGMLQI